MNTHGYCIATALILCFLMIGLPEDVRGYQEKEVTDGGGISGTVKFEGKIPEPKMYRLKDFYNDRYCASISDGKGNRVVQQTRVDDDRNLQDVVVYVKGIDEGKPFPFKGTDVQALHCQFLVQNGPSTLTGVVVKNKEMRLLNQDADPTDASTIMGVRHNPQSNEVTGEKNSIMFKQLLSIKGQVIKKKVKLKKKDSTVRLECDIHDFMKVYFLPVENPYYAVVETDGTFLISDIPPGKYEVLAWHPILGKMQKDIQVPSNGMTELMFTFTP